MPRQSATFSPNGGPLSVVVENGHANQGQYDLTLLENNEIDVAHRFPRAEFKTPADNTHVLPGPNSKHKNRVLDCVAAIGVLDPGKAFAVTMTLRQDGAEVGRVEAKDTASGVAHTVELILELHGT